MARPSLSKGLPNSVSVVALAERGTLLGWKGIAYMEKIAVGPAGKGHVSQELSIEENLKALASAKRVGVDDLTVISGELVPGVWHTANGSHAGTLAMRGKSGTVRRIQSTHNFGKLMRYSALSYDRGNGREGQA